MLTCACQDGSADVDVVQQLLGVGAMRQRADTLNDGQLYCNCDANIFS